MVPGVSDQFYLGTPAEYRMCADSQPLLHGKIVAALSWRCYVTFRGALRLAIIQALV